ncbi:MAG: hypothetical protein IJZ05_03235 [Rikenellaceae bacterium]|nr:hypothetical protein [Rikenellaceae bacterium]
MAAEHQDSNNEASLVEQVTEYVQLQLTATKLSAIEFLSLTLSNGFGILLAVVAAMFALMFILGAITLWVARAIGSLEWAMMISAAVFIIVGIVALTMRERMITNTLVRRFARMFFEVEDDHKTDAPND